MSLDQVLSKAFGLFLLPILLGIICCVPSGPAFALVDDISIGDMLEAHGAYVSRAEVVDVIDGSGPWDGDSTPGNDSSPSNKIVRTFDIVKYDVEYAMTPFDDAEYDYYRSARVGFKFVLPYADDKQAAFELDSMGWLDTSSGYEYQITQEMVGGRACQVLTCYRQLIGTGDSPIVVPGTSSVSFVFKVKGLPNGEVLRPEVFVFAAGSSAADNSTDYGNELGYRAVPPDVTVSALPRYNIQLKYSGEPCQSGNFNFATGNDAAQHKERGIVNGRYYCFGMILQLYNTSSSKQLKGIELPSGDITFDVAITSVLNYVPTDGTPSISTDVSSSYTPLLWVGEDENSNATKKNGRIVRQFGNSMVVIGGGASIYNEIKTNSGQTWIKSANKGGTWNIVQDGTTLHVTVSGYEINPDLFPYTYSNGTEGVHSFYNPATGIRHIGCFGCGVVWMVQPFNNLQTGTPALEEYAADSATFQVRLRDYNLNATGLSGASLAPAPADSSNQGNVGDDSPSASYAIHAPGTYAHEMGYTYHDNTTCAMSGTDRKSYPYNFSDGTDSATLGSPIRILYGSRHSPIDFENAQVATLTFLKFDDEVLTYNPAEELCSWHRSASGNYKSKLRYYFVAKDDRTGWTDDAEMKASVLTDPKFVFFSDYSQLESQNYTCVGVLAEDLYCCSDDVMLYSNTYYTIPFTVTSDPSKVGEVAMFTEDSYLWRRHTVAASAAQYLGKSVDELTRDDYQTYMDAEFPRIGDGNSLPSYPWEPAIKLNTGPSYDKAVYDANGLVSGGTGGYRYGDSLYIIGELAKITKSTAQRTGSSAKKIYDIDYQQRYADYVLVPSVEDSLGNPSSMTTTLTIEDVLPKGESYIPNSARYGGTYTEHTPSQGTIEGGEEISPAVTLNADSTTTLTFTLVNVDPASLQPLYYSVSIGNPGDPTGDVENNQTLTNTATISSTYDHRTKKDDYGNIAEYSIVISKLRQQSLAVMASPLYNEQNSVLTFHSLVGNYGSNALSDAIGINKMPWSGDSAGSSYSGTYTLQSLTIDKTQAGDLSDVRVYLTNDAAYRNKESSEFTRDEIVTWAAATVDPNTGAVSIPSGYGHAVAWAVLDDSLASEHLLKTEVKIAPTGNQPGDVYAMSLTDIDNTVQASVYVVSREISGVAWRDMDYDDTRGTADALLSGIRVSLVDSQGTVVMNFDNQALTSVTQSDGAYSFEKVPAGDYKVVFQPASGNWNGFEAVAKQSPRAGAAADSDADPVMSSGLLASMEITGVHMPAISEMATNQHLLRYMDAGIRELVAAGNLVKADYEDHGLPIAGAFFTLSGTSTLGTSVSKDLQSKPGGIIELGSLPYGSYTLAETSPAAGYLLPSSNWTVTSSASGISVSSSSGMVDGNKILNLKGHPALTITKTTTISGEVQPGDSIPYTITVSNTGNCVLSPVTIDDDLLGIHGEQVSPSLQPGASVSVQKVYSPVTYNDAANGRVLNVASAHGVPPAGVDPPEDPSASVSTTVTSPVPPATGFEMPGTETLLVLLLPVFFLAYRRTSTVRRTKILLAQNSIDAVSDGDGGEGDA